MYVAELHKTPDARGWVPPEGTRPWIVCAANKAEDGTIFCGSRHFSSAMSAQMEAAGLTREKTQRTVQGFIDQYDRFWTREQAMQIFKSAGQTPRDELRGDELFSENLY